jgi:hypothetical protein
MSETQGKLSRHKKVPSDNEPSLELFNLGFVRGDCQMFRRQGLFRVGRRRRGRKMGEAERVREKDVRGLHREVQAQVPQGGKQVHPNCYLLAQLTFGDSEIEL